MNQPVEIVNGPIAPSGIGGVIYSVTLGNGYVVTSPEGFGREQDSSIDNPKPQPRPLPQRQF